MDRTDILMPVLALAGLTFAVVLAWTFVALLVVHTAIHVTYNRVAHRATVFITGYLVLLALWCVVGRELLVRS